MEGARDTEPLNRLGDASILRLFARRWNERNLTGPLHHASHGPLPRFAGADASNPVLAARNARE